MSSRRPLAEIDEWVIQISRLILALMVLTVCLFILYDLLRTVVPAALEGVDGRDPNHFRNFFELWFMFASGVLVPLLALWALGFAKRQAVEAENTRIANVYMTITDRWNSEALVRSRMAIWNLHDEYGSVGNANPLKARATGAVDYINLRLIELRSTDRMQYMRHIAILIFLEDLGVLCEKKYIRAEDILEFIAAPICQQMILLAAFIDGQRADDTQCYINALKLRDQAIKFTEMAT